MAAASLAPGCRCAGNELVQLLHSLRQGNGHQLLLLCKFLREQGPLMVHTASLLFCCQQSTRNYIN